MLKDGLVSFVLKVSGAVLGFLVSLVVARLLGAHDAGLYFLALSVVTFASIVARLGLDHSTVRSVSRYESLGRHGELMSELRTALLVGFVSSALAALAIFVFSGYIAAVLFSESQLAPVLQWMAFAVIPLTQMYTYAQALNGLRRIVYGQLIDGLVMPLVNLVGIWLLATRMGPEGAALSFVLATAISALLGYRLWRLSHGDKWRADASMRWSYAAESMTSFWLSGMINQGILPLAPALLLGVWASAADVGVYSIASRVAFVLGFLLLALRPAVSAKFAAMEEQGDRPGMRDLHGRLVLFMFALVLVPGVVLLVWPGEVLSLFGHEFEGADEVLVILVVSQILNVGLGVSGYVLLMTGHATAFSKVSALSALLLVGLAVLLVPSQGMLGMAYAVLLMSLCYQGASTVLAFRSYACD